VLVKKSGCKQGFVVEEFNKEFIQGFENAIFWIAEGEDFALSFVSPRAEFITGYSIDEWKSDSHFFINHVTKDSRLKFLKLIAEVKSGQECEIVHGFQHRNDQVLWLRTIFRPVKNQNIQKLKFYGFSVDITRLVEVESQLRDSDARFRSLTESIPQIVFIANSEAQTSHFNQQWFDYTGISKNNTSFEAWVGAVHPDDLNSIMKSWEQARNTESAWVSEYRIRRSDGVYHWHLGRSVPLKDDQGVIIKWIGTATDIEHQKKIEGSLKEANENLESKVQDRTKELTQAYSFLDSVIENIPNMIFVKDAEDLRFVRFNRAGEELIGLSRDKLIGKSDFDFFPNSEADEFQRRDREVLSGKSIVDIPEEPMSTRDKGILTLHTKKIPVFGEDGVAKYLIGISEDITERKKIEAERLQFIEANFAKKETERNAERLNFLSKASALLGSSLDYEATLTRLTHLVVPELADWCSIYIVQPNKTLKQIALAHQFSEKDFRPQGKQRKFPLSSDANCGPIRVMKTGQSELVEKIDPQFLQEIARDSAYFLSLQSLDFCSSICTPIKSHGKIFGVLHLMTTDQSSRSYSVNDLQLVEDLSIRSGFAIENSQLYKEAQNLNRVKDEFLATLSHELRTPLNVIQGHVEILKTEFRDLSQDEIKISLDAISRNAKAQGQLINDLLDVSSIITGKISYKPTELSPLLTVQNIMKTLTPTAQAKGVELAVDLGQAPNIVSADPTRLHQIIWNLVSNAIKFTPSGGKVSISLKKNRLDWTLIVSDTGRGIDPEFLPYVYDRFRQEDSSVARKFGGLGLGLSIVRNLVELHGGEIKAESKGKNRGAQFIVNFPLSGLSQNKVKEEKKVIPVEPAKVERDKQIALKNVKILVVEDSLDNRVLVNRLLTKAGAVLVEAESPGEAREKLKKFTPDIIISDIGMPEENGIEFIRKLRNSKSGELQSIPAIALTAYVRQEEKEEALSAGFQAHVGKPFSSRQLLETIDQLLKD
jgi:PAS domain S-box-containing protein